MGEHTRDVELIAWTRAAAAGDERALERLLAAIYAPVVGFLYRRFDREREAEELARDLAQETLVHVAMGIGRCRAQTTPEFLAWAFEIARNVGRDLLRARGEELRMLRFAAEVEEISLVADPGVGQSPDGAGDATARALSEIVSGVTEVLPDATLRLLWIRLVEDGTWSEVADRLGTTAAGAKRRFQRAQATLRRKVLCLIEALPEPERSRLRARLVRSEEGE